MGNFNNLQKMTVSEAASEWLMIHCANLAKSTVYQYQTYFRAYILPVIGSKDIAEVHHKDIQRIINRMAGKGLAKKTQKNAVGNISSFFSYLVANGYIAESPVKKVIFRETTPYEYYIYSGEEFRKLLSCCLTEKDRTVLVLGGLCGLRLSEIFGLKWSDISFITPEKAIIHIHRAAVTIGNTKMDYKCTTKSAAGNRIIQLNKEASSELMQYYQNVKNKTGLLFPSKEDPSKPEMAQNFKSRFNRCIKRAGLPHTRFHDLRHFAATEFLDAAVPDKLAAAYLGHSDTNMTKKYQHIRKKVIPYPIAQ